MFEILKKKEEIEHEVRKIEIILAEMGYLLKISNLKLNNLNELYVFKGKNSILELKRDKRFNLRQLLTRLGIENAKLNELIEPLIDKWLTKRSGYNGLLKKLNRSVKELDSIVGELMVMVGKPEDTLDDNCDKALMTTCEAVKLANKLERNP